jgi:predicted small secreted protein
MKLLRIIALLSASLGLALSTSCSTTRGFGQDLQKVGDRIENRAEATGGTAPAPAASGPVVPTAY